MVALQVLSFLSLLAGLASDVSATYTLHPPAALIMARADTTPLKPLIMKPNKDLAAREFDMATNPASLGRLLMRQSGCPSGYGECNNPAGRCCPTGGVCCSGSGCCAAGRICYADGCCDVGEFGCAQNSCCPSGSKCCSGGGCCSSADNCVVVNGERGCCPIGETCTGSPSGTCSLPGYSPCTTGNYCCPTGDTCFTDSTGAPSCRSGGGTPPPASTPRPPPSATFSSVSTTPAPAPTTPSATGTGAGTGTPSAPRPTYSLRPAPQAPTGSTNQTIAASDPRIQYSASQWDPSSTCAPASMKCSEDGGTMTFQFIGTAIFMNLQVGRNGAQYSVEVDGTMDQVDGYAPTDSCTIGWSRFGLSSGLHTLKVTVVGPSPVGLNTAQHSVDFSGFLVTSSGNSSGGSGTSPGSAGPSGVASTALPTSIRSPAWLVIASAGLALLFSW